jgi:phage terminase large subunit
LAESQLELEVPEKLEPFFHERHRYKGAYGGRGSGKTMSFAIMLVLLAYENPRLRILCCREIQKTIKESVHQVISDVINDIGLGAFFTIKHDSIIGLNGSEFIFSGLRQLDVAKIKSLHNVHIAWAEEAQVITDKSWQVLIPTIRGEHPKFGNSEIWLSFNPELDTDPTYVRFVENTPPNSYITKINHSDNPWFPTVLEEERHYLEETDKSHGKVVYRHVWEGDCLPAVQGAIFATEVAQLFDDGRVRTLDYDPKGLVHVIMDLGYGVMTAILAQKFASTVQIIGYLELTHSTYHDLTRQLEALPYRWGKVFMPHDASHRDPKYGKSHYEVMQELGWETAEIPQIGVENYIEAGRQLFGNVYVSDGEDCRQLIHCLRRWRYQVSDTDSGSKKTHPPMKDEFSHGAEAFCYTAVIADDLVNSEAVVTDPYRGFNSGYAA